MGWNGIQERKGDLLKQSISQRNKGWDERCKIPYQKPTLMKGPEKGKNNLGTLSWNDVRIQHKMGIQNFGIP